jgi:hypothetical protein
MEFALFKLMECGGGNVFGDAFIAAGSALSQLLGSIRTMNRVVSQAQRDNLVELACVFLRACDASGLKHVPKHHLIVHLADRTDWHRIRECMGRSTVEGVKGGACGHSPVDRAAVRSPCVDMGGRARLPRYMCRAPCQTPDLPDSPRGQHCNSDVL